MTEKQRLTAGREVTRLFVRNAPILLALPFRCPVIVDTCMHAARFSDACTGRRTRDCLCSIPGYACSSKFSPRPGASSLEATLSLMSLHHAPFSLFPFPLERLLLLLLSREATDVHFGSNRNLT